MARKYGASDLGSEWVNVPRNFRGRKSTSSPTTLAYITAPERGLLKQYALMNTGKDQVGPEGIPSYDDSGFNDPATRTLGTYTPGTYNFGNKPGPNKGTTRTLADIRRDAQKNILAQADAEKDQAPGTPAVIRAKAKTFGNYPRDIHPPVSTSKPPEDEDKGGRDCPHGWTGTWPRCEPPQQDQDTGTDPECSKDADCDGGKCENGKCRSKETTTCFVDGVQVELADGSKKNVSKISVGDIVKTKEGSGSVVKVFPAKAGNQLLYGFNGKDPFVTEAHPFMTQDGWKKISDVKEGDILYRNGLGNQVVESIESKEIPEDTPVYNFHVDNHENYYADGYLVHNKTEQCEGVMHKGVCHTKCEDTMGEVYTGTHPYCKLKGAGDDTCGGGGGGGNTILKPDFSFDLLALSDEMDIRNALSNIMNKNNPLFKQARTRALQAMAARGIVNSSMSEEAVMSAMLNVAMPIAERLITDLQNVMYRNQERGDAFKTQMNEMYMKELIARMEISGRYRLQGMTESHANWRSYVEAMLGGASISDQDQFKKYMDMISGMKPGSSTSASRSSGTVGL